MQNSKNHSPTSGMGALIRVNWPQLGNNGLIEDGDGAPVETSGRARHNAQLRPFFPRFGSVRSIRTARNVDICPISEKLRFFARFSAQNPIEAEFAMCVVAHSPSSPEGRQWFFRLGPNSVTDSVESGHLKVAGAPSPRPAWIQRAEPAISPDAYFHPKLVDRSRHSGQIRGKAVVSR
ncbi:hypothetical protein HUJ04_000285 [Dendroctonus ponderosae]|nr:hypothetical protein HUJ04_000285 [Dendroctonus ponderosae]